MAITFKKLSGDTEVVANPTLDGSETALSGLQIDGVKYAMGGGSSGVGTLQWVYKEEVIGDNTGTYSSVNNYMGKILYLVSDYAKHIVTCVDTWKNDLMLWSNYGNNQSSSECMLILKMNSNGTINFKGTTGTTFYRWKIYELVVA